MNHSVVTIGTFDGVHLGHQHLIKRLLNIANKKRLKSILVTFVGPFREVHGVITTKSEKLDLLKRYPLDEIVVLPNSREVMGESALSFFENFLHKKLKAKCIVVGDTFAFGHKREGTINWLKKKGALKDIEVKVIPT